jgi:microcystin-dependent protein
MSCSNCYNGCQEITSDKCVKYTGNNSVPLGIDNGDNVNSVLETLITKVVSFLDGSGIDISINLSAYCELVTKYLPNCNPQCDPPTLVEIIEALVKAACDLQGQINATNTAVDAVEEQLATLNANYTLPSSCLTGVTASSDTHDIVQAIINKLCALSLDVSTNYVKLADLDALIASYLASTATVDKYYTKMVPYTVVEYYGPLSGYPSVSDGFSVSGAGFGFWEKIYLCNGNNGTPDKRGRSPIGAIAGMGGGVLDTQVNPASSPLNLNYALGTKNGVNGVILSVSNLPSHTHTVQSAGAHTHEVIARSASDGGAGVLVGGDDDAINNGTATTSSNGVHSHVVDPTGGDAAHANTHPVIACLYIMYIP